MTQGSEVCSTALARPASGVEPSLALQHAAGASLPSRAGLQEERACA
ncbi:MAG: hypothetical protein LC098_09430 [Burkholderiales bacterium]|nr:hypothetical protein [Burkholderiales bacterium]